MLIFIIPWLLLAIAVGIGANTKGRNGLGWFLIALMLSPLIAGALVIALPNPKIQQEAQRHTTCPACAEQVLKAAKVCKHCGATLVPQEEDALPSPTIAENDKQPEFKHRKLIVAITTIIFIALVAGLAVSQKMAEHDERMGKAIDTCRMALRRALPKHHIPSILEEDARRNSTDRGWQYTWPAGSITITEADGSISKPEVVCFVDKDIGMPDSISVAGKRVY